MKILATITKEFLLLTRDPAGMALIFIMPLALVIVMSLIQDAPFRDYQEIRLDVLFIDADRDSLGQRIEKAFEMAPNIHLVEHQDSIVARKWVGEGRYKAAIILPAGATVALRSKTSQLIGQVVANLGLNREPPDSVPVATTTIPLLFDPAIKINYKQALSTQLEKILANIQTEWVLNELQTQLGRGREKKKIEFAPLIHVGQHYATQKRNEMAVLNSVQHNVPAWTLFAMFFILFPLAGNFIKEREEGSMLRIQLIAGSQLPAIVGKFFFYFCVCLFQFAMMIAVGVYLMPLIGLEKLVLGNNLFGTLLTACAIALAATGYGLLIAVYFRTPQQALSFGSTSVVILAALGGVWVPVYVMPETLQSISRLSPLNWGLESFNNLFLRDTSTMTILPDLMKLVCFAIVTLVAGILIHRSRTIS